MIDPKRGLDIVASVTGLVVLSPVLGVVGLCVKATSAGPVLFRQERVGRNGELFTIHKFRTMSAGDGLLVSTSDDPRITRVGRLLRQTKLDELPQLFDVLRGDMSLVGPRPEVPRYVAMWPEEQRDVVLSVRPGITDPASIRFRDEGSRLSAADDPETYYRDVVLPEKCAMYVQYVNGRSLRGDLKIIWQTLFSIAVG